MSDPAATVGRMYAALADQDVAALERLLLPDFVGEMSAGMPLGVGGPVEGRRQMLAGVWGEIGARFQVEPLVHEVVEVADDRVLVIGEYRGSARATGRPFAATFLHDVRVRGEQIASLRQITDTHQWHRALGA